MERDEYAQPPVGAAARETMPPTERPFVLETVSPQAVAGKNRLLGAALAGVALVVLATVITLMLLIRFEHLPSLLSYFS